VDPTTGDENWLQTEGAYWAGVPLGLTPDQTAESLCLIVDEQGGLFLDEHVMDTMSTPRTRIAKRKKMKKGVRKSGMNSAMSARKKRRRTTIDLAES
jgi:hypothetical protein